MPVLTQRSLRSSLPFVPVLIPCLRWRWDPSSRNNSSSSSPSRGTSASSSGRRIPALIPALMPSQSPAEGKDFLGQKRDLLSSLLSALRPHRSLPLLPSRAQGWAVSEGKDCSAPTEVTCEDFCPHSCSQEGEAQLQTSIFPAFCFPNAQRGDQRPSGPPSPPQSLLLLLAEAALGFPARFGPRGCWSPTGRVSLPAPVGNVQPTPSQTLQDSACPLPVAVPRQGRGALGTH